jgi:hypothetical protein
VQALRLEYYEFFGKFYSGTGRPFAPFRLSPAGLTVPVVLENDFNPNRGPAATLTGGGI